MEMWFWSKFLILLYILQAVICAEDLYKLLAIDKHASDRDIKRAYQQLSKRYHPDKNPGNDEVKQMFYQVAEAYEILSDSESRKIYDNYGYEAVKQRRTGDQGSHDPMDVFSQFFGGGNHFGHQAQRKGPDMEMKIEVPLADFYNGRIFNFKLEKQQICDKCDGSGSSDGQVETCSMCNGHGIQIKRQMFAPGIFQQIQVTCETCKGQGKIIKHKCPACHGNRVVRKVTSFPLNIEKGTPNGKVIVYENDADESPDYEAGDLYVTLVEKEVDEKYENELRVDGIFFRRKGDNLFWKEVLSLREAWLGSWTRNISHLDGHIVTLGRSRGEVIQPGQVERVVGQGMPKWHENGDSVFHSTEYGDLLVEYTVVLPDQMVKGMEKDFWALWEKWRSKIGVDLQKDSGRPLVNYASSEKDEL